ncbi:hypothetical protein [Bradyrhizobium sp. BR13661]|jgi:hypothetical protein|uniref:hypothetical protein n=1 Tax=Bradyrhizobium sp. BR13661 TaxID=2940622 RepID=UPI002476325A|nr:hypothetical protein [Bradyrhizobium sp. BR13661]MDH6263753.1 hypothetical protein [Bradyrhizobium sp. BR13661]
MKAYLVAVNLPVHAHNNPESAVAWMTAGDDLSSIIAFSLPHDDTPDKFAPPLWPLGTVR